MAMNATIVVHDEERDLPQTARQTVRRLPRLSDSPPVSPAIMRQLGRGHGHAERLTGNG